MSPTLKKRKVAFSEAEKTAKPAKAASTVKGASEKGKAKAQTSQADSNPIPAPQTRSSKFKIIAGSYEKILYGLEGELKETLSETTLKPIFIFPAHLSCIKALATSPQGGKWLASGAGDENC